MTLRIGINGFGRIGKAVARILQDHDCFELVAINDLAQPAALAHGFKYDSVFRRFPGEVSAGEDFIEINGRRATVSREADPANINWAAAGVDFVMESTGRFRKLADLQKHINAGARKVFLSVPAKEKIDATIVMGVNDHLLTGDEIFISNASCTTNAAAPLVSVLHREFGIERGFLSTIHAYTNGQRLIDAQHRDWRRARAAPMSIIPTTTGAAKAVTKVIPELAGKLNGMAYRVPVSDGSIVDLVLNLSRETTVEEVNQTVAAAAQGPLRGILEYQTDPIVSVDILGNPHSAIFDAPLTQVIDGKTLHVAAWYDNEWGYSCRMVDLVKKYA